MKILVLGVTGMLGSAVFKYIASHTSHSVFGTMRGRGGRKYFDEKYAENFYSDVDVLDYEALVGVFEQARPDVVINCVGLIKQLAQAKDPLSTLPLNSMLPHRLSKLCALIGARLVHISTDCVFTGEKGMYLESDISDAVDLYGKSKFIGEVQDQPHAITLRTSIIGHELASSASLVDWFLSQEGAVKGFTKAIFSGVPTSELARIITDFVIPNPQLFGLYHVSAEPIDKFTLLNEIAKIYEKKIDIVPDDHLAIDRSLDSTRFRQAVGYVPPAWPDLIQFMRAQR
ncbi:SDR family oxidoreductase [Pseudomonas fluorescens]|jgi:dTDP-4-dehydrorhamnose reductase|uniref:dTDP-4-dehydrorhamnose reductase n=1 Tax=Pseudomonas fluorescens TaxID=294 RepID=A0A2N1DWA9_PSEFL|nr:MULTISPECIES: SDR family oxidoreductase [Pseudomonas]MBD8100300.1 SDR family oxidoreductase [Pseudomonas fluorescens]MBD8776216.1 SDR family oxidoreductase [Pseudomonas fluorescens]MBD8781902.1 SDR family oxidoreductase [Pseudomonas fluorescens]MBD8797900.1 SDR family oxidoreductase [Pseudomonas fluorescens]PKH14148.1 NAD(P)-dependent oxidoreductase [Pseudomonas fluorescens]